jgi:hypothetical protein
MESIISIVSFFIFNYGCFIILDISLFSISDDILMIFNKEKTSIKHKVLKTTKKEKNKGFRKTVKDAKNILILMNKEERFNFVWFISILLFVIGVIISLSLNNYFLVPVLAIGFAFVPFWYIIYISNYFRKQVNEELETALSTITTSYMRSENIVLAVEENIEYLNPPIKEVFEFFLSQTKLITSNTKLAIKNLKPKIHNEVFREWCDILIACQDNRNFKSTLIPTISKLSDTRVVTAEISTIMAKPIREFLTMMVILLANIPIIRVLNKSWYEILVNSSPGHFILSVIIIVVFISIGAVIKLTRPVEYRG